MKKARELTPLETDNLGKIFSNNYSNAWKNPLIYTNEGSSSSVFFLLNVVQHETFEQGPTLDYSFSYLTSNLYFLI